MRTRARAAQANPEKFREGRERFAEALAAFLNDHEEATKH
jgi:hypothetical protein